MCMFRNTQQHSISKHALTPASAGMPALLCIHPGQDTPPSSVWRTSQSLAGHHRQMHRCIDQSQNTAKSSDIFDVPPSETAAFASVIYRFAITVVVHPTDTGFVLRELSSRLIWASSKTINIRYIEDCVTIQPDCARWTRRYSYTCQGHERWKVAQAHHGQPHGQAGRISWRREKKGRFHESSWPLGGRPWSVMDHQIVGARRDPISSVAQRFLCVASLGYPTVIPAPATTRKFDFSHTGCH
jgi:hypothetical protein